MVDMRRWEMQDLKQAKSPSTSFLQHFPLDRIEVAV